MIDPQTLGHVRYGMTEQQTKLAQWALKLAGSYKGRIDGWFWLLSDLNTRQFQSAHGLKNDGVIGGETWVKLVSYIDAHLASGGTVPDEVVSFGSGGVVIEPRVPGACVVEWAMFPFEIDIPTAYLQRLADAHNWYSEKVWVPCGHKPFRVTAFEDVRDVDPDKFKYHYLANGTLGVEGVGGFHSNHIAPGDDDIDRYAVSNAALPRRQFEPITFHESGEGTNNGGVNKFYDDPIRPWIRRFAETHDWVQGSLFEIEQFDVIAEHCVTENYLMFADGEPADSFDSAKFIGAAPIVTDARSFGPNGGWGIIMDTEQNLVMYVSGSTVEAAAAMPLNDGNRQHLLSRLAFSPVSA